MWSFAAIGASEPERASTLANAPQPHELAAGVGRKLEEAVDHDTARFALEQAGRDSTEVRAVIQFRVGETLFDQFFNAATGYRAQYRQHWRQGLAYNAQTIEALRAVLAQARATEWSGRLLNADFEDVGPIQVNRTLVLKSLDVELSKIWFCTRLVSPGGSLQFLAAGVLGPRLQLDDGTSWAAPSRTEAESWLDVKGAFVTGGGLWQPKDPVQRAHRLQATGEA